MEIPTDPRFKNIAGQKFHRLTVLEYSGPAPGRQKFWLCRCDCGTEKRVRSASLLSGGTKSCGCLTSEVTTRRNTTHGLRHHPLYPCWNNMVHRCTNPKAGEWHRYGARGISVCPAWMDFRVFAHDMGECPPGMSLDRREVNGNYEPGNCRWATLDEQNNNKRTSRFVTIGERTQTLSQWAKELGLARDKVESVFAGGREARRKRR